MKNILSLIAVFVTLAASAQNLKGAWKLVNQNGKPFEKKELLAIR